MKRAFAILLVLVTCLAAAASAEVPRTLSYQGVLVDGSGTVVPDGLYGVTFALYAAASGGAALWTETASVQISRGIFNAILGSVEPLDLLFDVPYWLGISVSGGAELAPRTALASAAYSLNARSVNGEQNVFPSTENVGIGTKTPGAPLHIVTDAIRGIRLDGMAAGSWSLIQVNATNSGSNPGVEYCRQGTAKAMTYVGAGDNWNLRLGGTDALAVKSTDRNLGVGVADPLEKLDVAGALRLGGTTGTNAGTMRWTGSDFEG